MPFSYSERASADEVVTGIRVVAPGFRWWA
jgi:hypothetical protein